MKDQQQQQALISELTPYLRSHRYYHHLAAPATLASTDAVASTSAVVQATIENVEVTTVVATVDYDEANPVVTTTEVVVVDHHNH